MIIIIAQERRGVEEPQQEEQPNDKESVIEVDEIIDEKGRRGCQWFNWWSGRSGIVWEDEEPINPIVYKMPH